MDRAELKARARAQLGGGIFQNLWMMGLAVCLLIGLLESAAAGIIPGIGALLVVGPLEYGMAYIFLKQARDISPCSWAICSAAFRTISAERSSSAL